MDYPIEYKGFKITVESGFDDVGYNHVWIIHYRNGDLFGGSEDTFTNEEDAIKDAKAEIDNYYDQP